MTALRLTNARASSAPRFTTYTEVEVDIEPSDLEAAGWVYVGEGEAGPTTERAIDTVRAWHDREHPDAWPWCRHELCHQLRPSV